MKETLFFILLTLGLASPTSAATISVNASNPGPRLNARMYGIFLEEINFGVDGGLYAELIRNRGFEDAKPPEGFSYRDGKWLDEKGYDARFSRFGYVTNGLPFWRLVKQGDADGSLQLELEKPLNAATPRSARLKIRNLGSGKLGIANEGFWGIGVARGEKYHLSFWARCADGFNGPLTATLESQDGTACSTTEKFKGVTGEWKQFKATLTGIRNEPKANSNEGNRASYRRVQLCQEGAVSHFARTLPVCKSI